jgi:N-acetylmuramic acid 6-phosphate (MurNAc-6-P) etherase
MTSWAVVVVVAAVAAEGDQPVVFCWCSYARSIPADNIFISCFITHIVNCFFWPYGKFSHDFF